MNKLTTFHTQSYADMINRIGLGLSVSSDNMEEMRKESTISVIYLWGKVTDWFEQR